MPDFGLLSVIFHHQSRERKREIEIDTDKEIER